MLCAVVDIGSNTTRLLVAEPGRNQLRKVMEQRAYTRIGAAIDDRGRIAEPKVVEVCEAVVTQVRLARELKAARVRIVATAAIREATNGELVARRIEQALADDGIAGAAGEIAVEILSERDEGRLAFTGATKALGHPVEGRVAVVDVGGGSTEIVIGTVAGGVESVRSWPVGSGSLTDRFIHSDPPTAYEIESIRGVVEAVFAEVELEPPDRAVAVGGSASSTRRLVGSLIEHETLERALGLLGASPSATIARRFDIDLRRVGILISGVLILEQVSDLLAMPLQVGRGGLREGAVLDLLERARG